MSRPQYHVMAAEAIQSLAQEGVPKKASKYSIIGVGAKHHAFSVPKIAEEIVSMYFENDPDAFSGKQLKKALNSHALDESTGFVIEEDAVLEEFEKKFSPLKFAKFGHSFKLVDNVTNSDKNFLNYAAVVTPPKAKQKAAKATKTFTKKKPKKEKKGNAMTPSK